MKQVRLFLLVIVLLSLTTAGTYATGYFHGVPEFSSGTCLRRYVTTNYISKLSTENWGNTYCCATATFETSTPAYNYLYVEAIDGAGHVFGGRSKIINSAQYGYPVSLYSTASNYNEMHLRVSNPYYIANGTSNSINMRSNGLFWSQFN